MILTEKAIQKDQKWLKKFSPVIKEHSDWCQVMSDPTRAKIMLLLKSHKELCVSDIAQILNMSISAISHQLSYLENQGVLGSKKMGKVVCYSLKLRDKEIIKCLEFNFRGIKK